MRIKKFNSYWSEGLKEIDKIDYIFSNWFVISNKLQTLGDKLDDKITVKQLLILAIIFKHENHTANLSMIANIAGVSRQNIKKIVVILERQGFVTLNKDVHDKRSVNISITKQAIEHFKTREEKEVEFINKLFNGFDKESTGQLFNAIQKLQQNINDMEGLF